MEKFKKLEDIYLPDTRSERSIRLENRYKILSEDIVLNEMVPDDVVSQFNIARNLCLYTWFSYSFHQVSELKAFSVLEYSLKGRYKKRGLRNLINLALKDGLINDLGFRHVDFDPQDPTEYCRTLPKFVPDMRNKLAHGSCKLLPNSLDMLALCADFINQVYAGPPMQDYW